MWAGRGKVHYKTTGTIAGTTPRGLETVRHGKCFWVFPLLCFYRLLKARPKYNKHFKKEEPFSKLTFSLNFHSLICDSYF